MRPLVEKIKMYYDKGIYKKAQIDKMYESGKITYEEYRYILGEVNDNETI